ncbi:RDD family protein [Mariniblastus sp.]|nr:RDD family protein [bacterium]MDB4379939.1 RDD family protein [Mariniblastus sp.]MDC0294482.1 RDD family protein [Mariniblastus sp.]
MPSHRKFSATETDSMVRGVGGLNGPQTQDQKGAIDTMMMVKTPENISFQYEISGPFYRFNAYIVDLIFAFGGYFAVVALFYFILLLVVGLVNQSLGISAAFFQLFAGITYGLVLVGFFLVYWFYGAYMETRFNGQTLGKRLCGIRVISVDGHAIDGVQATLRNFFRFLDIMPIVPLQMLLGLDSQVLFAIPTFLIGLVVMSLNRKFQRVGDLVAGTVVIFEEKKYRPDLIEFDDERVPNLADLIPADFVASRGLTQVVAEFAEKRKYLGPQRSADIAKHLAVPLMERFGIPADTDPDLFMCSLYHRLFVTREGDESPMGTEKELVKASVPEELETGSEL